MGDASIPPHRVRVKEHPGPSRPGRAQNFLQLSPHPLMGERSGQPRTPPDAPRRVGLELKAQLGGKAHPAEHPQGVLGKALFRLPHAPDELPPQILPSAEGIDHRPIRGQGHGVDGKIPPGQVLLQRGVEAHLPWVASVGIAALPPEGGDLHRPVPGEHGDRPVAHAGGDRTGKEGHHGLRPRRRGQVKVARRPSQEQSRTHPPTG